MTDITSEPCFRRAMLWGIATGAGIGLHRFRISRQIKTACDYATFSFVGVSGVTWYVHSAIACLPVSLLSLSLSLEGSSVDLRKPPNSTNKKRSSPP
ncbi:Aste57867_18608 [Aphanomyces stellatus]|uniref:Cytochrome c oxidase assembly protein COX20, mitochondrial n=1 Tax=Aphanomyces stellatus TaxID=120398 RepID=A0A485LAJ6_9STRA|nr:hypothetical protein As57867_018546 [Aphanomyces stellatus]VFT95343.1 Aste57867_18608 [Aphanomyces stellatus]